MKTFFYFYKKDLKRSFFYLNGFEKSFSIKKTVLKNIFFFNEKTVLNKF